MSSEKKEKKSEKKSHKKSHHKSDKKSSSEMADSGEKLNQDDLITQAKLWITSTKNTQKIKYRSCKAAKRMLEFEFAEDELEFEIKYPETSAGKWTITCDGLDDDFGNDVRKKCTAGCGIAEVLSGVCAVYKEYNEGGDDDGDDDEVYGDDDDGFGFADEPVKKTRDTSDDGVDTSKFSIPSSLSPAAVQAIAKELGSLQRGKLEDRQYEAAPMNNQINIWEVKIYGIPKDEPLWKDMQKWGTDHITAMVVFANNYPFAPPFIRLLRPRFQLRTGHVTIGGAICTYALSSEGWSPLYRLEQIIVDIRCNFTEGKGRLDMSNKSDYTESEAMDAFNRLLRTHGWTHWKK